MARGDLVVFEEAKKLIQVNVWGLTDQIWIGLVTSTPVVDDTEPAYAAGGTTNYAAIATAGEYAVGGLLLDTWDAMVLEAGGVATFDDTGEFVTWAQNGASPQDAEFAVIYHKISGLCIAMIDLAGPIDMRAGDLTITWDALGIYTIT
jgi:hypothetical protein